MAENNNENGENTGELSQQEIDALMEGASPFDFDSTTKEAEEEGTEDSSKEDGKEEELSDISGMFEEESKPQKEKKKSAEKGKGEGGTLDSDNMELLLDVSMSLTVELGRTRKNVKDVLSYGEGSIVELERLNGEPVDILVNGRRIARGEVVVIDESYGVKVTELLDPYDRFNLI